MKRFPLFIAVLFISLHANAQHSIQSSVFDDKNGQALEMATVRLLSADSALIKGAQTDEKGSFTLSKIKKGDYILVVSSVGYKILKRNIYMDNRDLILKPVQLKEDVELLKEVDVKGTAAQMVVKGDTLEYNATAFKTQENAVVEDLLKKLPGVEVSTEGKITVNGEEIKKIRVDGKKFFDGDIEQASKNLPADMIEKVQVLDQKSDMAQLTGFEDSDTERIINLTTKPNRRKGIFGNIYGAAGADLNEDFRYDAGASVNIMRGNAQTSINAGGNNLNNSRSSRGRGNWGGGANGGITTSQNIGINNNTEVNDKVKIGGDMTLNHGSNLSITKSNRESYLSDITYNDISAGSSMNDKYAANMRLEMEWKPDSLNTFIFQPNMNYNQTSSDAFKDYSYLTEGDSTSWGDSHNWGDGTSLSGGLNLIFNHKFTSKKGRNFTIRLNTNFSQNNNDSYNVSSKYTPDSTTLIDQYSTNLSNNYSTGLRMSFVEPLWNNKNMIEAAVSLNNSSTYSQKEQYDLDTINNTYTNYNSEYSNTFKNNFYQESIELNYRYTEQNYNIMLGLNAQPSQTENIRTYGDGQQNDTTYGVFNFAPTARLKYNLGKKQFIRLDYRGRTQQPSISQMQPVKNNSDLMNETVGNPGLDPAFSNNFRLMYSSFNATKFSSFNTFINFNFTKDALVSNKIYDNTLKQYNQTVNLKDNMPVSAIWNIMYNTPLIAKTLHFNTNTRFNYSTNYAYTSYNIDADKILSNSLSYVDLNLSRTRNYNSSEELSLTYTSDYVELGLRGNIQYGNSLNNLKNIQTETWDWTGRANMVIRFPYNFTLSSDIAYSDRAGYTNMDLSEIMWNASLDKTMFKNKGTLSLIASDILHQRLNIRQSIGDNYIQNSSYNTLPTYVLVKFAYKLNRFGGQNMRQSFSRGMRGGDRGGFGGGPEGSF
ncbi:MAG: TonB-dependent receptor [Paludibacter sp.]|nr:TonB-dependent receptor [Paludibacter sp.]